MSIWVVVAFAGGVIFGLWIFEQIRIAREERGWRRLRALKIHEEARFMVQAYFADQGLFGGDEYWAAQERLLQWERHELEMALLEGRNSYDLIKEGFNAALPGVWP